MLWRGHELLLLADGGEEAEGVDAEAEHAHEAEREQAEHAPRSAARRARGHAGRASSRNGQQQPGRELDPHAGGHGRGACAQARIGRPR